MRGLKKAFLEDLQLGKLKPILDAVRNDHSICLEIRDNYINLYFKGGNLLKLQAVRSYYNAIFDSKYAKEHSDNLKCNLPADRIYSEEDANQWLEYFPVLKGVMEQFWQQHPNQERQAQQLMVVDNNFADNCRNTDYYICDIEYAISKEYRFHKRCRFDMVAVRWPSTDSHQTNQKHRRLVLIEVKYGEGSLTGQSGLQKHVQDIDDFLGIENNLNTFKYEMANVFNQKRNLGLVACEQELQGFNDERPMLILALLNLDLHNPKLREALSGLPDTSNVEICIATGWNDGFGLTDQNILKAP